MKKDYIKQWNNAKYQKIFAKRAKGTLPEMESSKAVAQILDKWIRNDDKILDVGCGVGHYYVSLKNKIKKNFQYFGLDIKEDYIKEAKKIFKNQSSVHFKKGDIYDLPFKNNFFEIVMFNNTLENLPSIDKPIKELLRVTKNYLLLRVLVDERSFYIKEVIDSTFTKNGEPKKYFYFNIYSRDYLKKIILKYSPKCKINFKKDLNFNPKAISKSLINDGKKKFFNPTKIIGNLQVNGPILMNWEFIKIKK